MSEDREQHQEQDWRRARGALAGDQDEPAEVTIRRIRETWPEGCGHHHDEDLEAEEED